MACDEFSWFGFVAGEKIPDAEPKSGATGAVAESGADDEPGADAEAGAGGEAGASGGAESGTDIGQILLEDCW